jgi:uncharacterized protein (DUF1778 family)
MTKVATFPTEARSLKNARVELKTRPDLNEMLREAAAPTLALQTLMKRKQNGKNGK